MKKQIIIFTLLGLLSCACMACKDKSNQDELEKNYAQLTTPSEGEDIAIIKTSMGDITVRFFPEYAPRAVENFMTHAADGYYDGCVFYRVVNEFLIQAGDPTNTGLGSGESIWGEPFGTECTPDLHHIRGALCMANAGGANTSIFYIVQNSDIGDNWKEEFQYYIDNPDTTLLDNSNKEYKVIDRFPVPYLEYYIEHGGMWRLDGPGFHFADGAYTVFGQVIDGMDVVDAIVSVEVSGVRPLVDIVIDSIVLEQFSE